jgi:PAS domain S-box-containing protein
MHVSSFPRFERLSPASQRLVTGLAVALIYWLVARLALLLAIQPGYAAPIWPAAGIALAAVLRFGPGLWPAIALGSFCANVATSFDATSFPVLLRSLAIAAAIAAGASLQAALGAALVKRAIGFPIASLDERRVAWFLLLAGPFACLASATFGVATLRLFDLISGPQVLFSWCTWWIGDTIGVLLVSPLALVWWSEPQSTWRPRRVSLALPLLVACALQVLFFMYTRAQEDRRMYARFLLRSERVVEALRAEFDGPTQSVESLASLYGSARNVDRAAFRRFAARTLRRYPSVRALAWAQRSEGLDGSEQVIFRTVEPESAAALRGYDLASSAVARDALMLARDTDQAAGTRLLALPPLSPERNTVLLIAAVYATGADGVARGEKPLGFAVAALDVKAALAPGLARLARSDVDVYLTDPAEPVAPAMVSAAGFAPSLPRTSAFRPRARNGVEIGGRRWILELSARPEYLFAEDRWVAWSVLALSLLCTSLLGVFLLVIAGRSVEIESVVDQRTAELRRNQAMLRQILDTAHDAFVGVDAGGLIVEWNPRAEALFGWTRDEACGRSLLETLIPARYREAQREALKQVLATGESPVLNRPIELPVQHRDGRELMVELTASPSRAEQGWRFNAFLRDVSARKAVEALREREILIKEIHHRVKNNLQVISSLLNLQRRLMPEDLAGVLEDMQARVASIALFHEKLYRSDDLARVEIGDYLRELAALLLQQYRRGAQELSLTVEAENLECGVETAIPCGLIANELITNALKHAFPEGRRGAIRVEVHHANGSAELSVADDGIGLPPELDIAATQTLGLQVVCALARQLHGNVAAEVDHGTRFRLSFPVSHAA